MAQLVETPAAGAPRHLPVLQAVEPDVVPHKDNRAAGHVDTVTKRACSQTMDCVSPGVLDAATQQCCLAARLSM